MFIIAQIFIGIVALLHVLFFRLESIVFTHPRILKRFGLDEAGGVAVKPWAFNQGFYNLFLAFGLFYSLYLLNFDQVLEGKTLASFILWTITWAGVVLAYSVPGKMRVAMIQGLPALIGVIFLYFS